MRVIPAIDLIQGRCVRLLRGDFNSARGYEKSPGEIAHDYVSSGLSRIHVVDLDGARAGQIVQWETLSVILSVPGIDAQVGGGVRSEESIERLLNMGAKQVVLGSVAVCSPETILSWVSRFGPQHFCIATDLHHGVLSVSGWTKKETNTIDMILSKLEPSGILDYLCTDISKDGTLEGPNFELYQALVRDHPEVRWIASGGISSLQDLEVLRLSGVSGVVIGKALYEGKITLEDLAHFAKTRC